MSMLTEKRRKQKFLLNPQGKHWLGDSNKFGFKLLESMGWSEGKGLGKEQDGITEPIRVAFKNDNKGLGLKETASSMQQERFDALLDSLNDNNNSESSQVSSLETKSQNSRARVHYKKFTRGKDLSRYSEKDIANILERKTIEKVKEEMKPSERDDNVMNRGSMTDYFNSKMSSGKVKLDKSEMKDDSNSENECGYGFGFKTDVQAPSFVSYISDKGLTNPAFEPLKQNFTMSKHTLHTIDENEEEGNDESVNVIIKTKKKKKKMKCEETIPEITNSKYEEKKVKKHKKGVDNPVLQLNNSDDGVEAEKLKKRKKGVDNPVLLLNNSDNGMEVEMLKKRKKGVDNPVLQLNDSDDGVEVEKVKKRKTGVDNPVLQLNNSDDSVEIEKVKRPKNGVDNLALQLNQSDDCVEVQKTKKQKNADAVEIKKQGIDNPALNLDTIEVDLMLNVVDEPIQKKPKSRRNLNSSKNIFGGKRKLGSYDNRAFDAKAQKLEESINSISQTIEMYQAEVENDINEIKDIPFNEDFYVGDVNGNGENERRMDGIQLGFKYATFTKDRPWTMKYNDSVNMAKKSYKHLIKGDIHLGFKDCNLHKIKGYRLGNKL
ncbi:hypothetical protein FQA39_LY18208 [Lamprigera yunnana]|nr:hypothetical protein FQA39_LY18208 [Lamprigera yunnana]